MVILLKLIVQEAEDKFAALLMLKVNLTRKFILTPLMIPNFTLDLVVSIQDGQFVLWTVNVDPMEEKYVGKFHYDRYIFLLIPVIELDLYPHVLELRETPKFG